MISGWGVVIANLPDALEHWYLVGCHHLSLPNEIQRVCCIPLPPRSPPQCHGARLTVRKVFLTRKDLEEPLVLIVVDVSLQVISTDVSTPPPSIEQVDTRVAPRENSTQGGADRIAEVADDVRANRRGPRDEEKGEIGPPVPDRNVLSNLVLLYEHFDLLSTASDSCRSGVRALNRP